MPQKSQRGVGLIANGVAAAFLLITLIRESGRGARFDGSDLIFIAAIAAYIGLNAFLVWRHVQTDSEIQALEKDLAKAELRKRIREAEQAR